MIQVIPHSQEYLDGHGQLPRGLRVSGPGAHEWLIVSSKPAAENRGARGGATSSPSLVCTRSRGRRGRTWGAGSPWAALWARAPRMLPGHHKGQLTSTRSFPGPHGGQSGPQARGKRQLYAGHTGSRGESQVAFTRDGGLERLAQSPGDVWPWAPGRGSGGTSGSGLATRCRCLSGLSRPSGWASGRAGGPRQRPLKSKKEPHHFTRGAQQPALPSPAEGTAGFLHSRLFIISGRLGDPKMSTRGV